MGDNAVYYCQFMDDSYSICSEESIVRSYTYRWCCLLLACMVLALGLAGQAGAVTVTLPASQDNTLYENSAGALSNGAGEFFFAGRNGGAGGQIAQRGLIQFDVASQIPLGALKFLYKNIFMI